MPFRLVKAFEKLQYARDFAEGNIRFSSLAYYRSTADPDRCDVTEGFGEVHVDGDVLGHDQAKACSTTESIRVRTKPWERYICCLSIPDAISVPHLKTAFGNNFVVVHSPQDFVHDVEDALFRDSVLADQGEYPTHIVVRTGFVLSYCEAITVD